MSGTVPVQSTGVSGQSAVSTGTRSHSPQPSPACSVCAKSVFKTEEVSFQGKVMHAQCFKCGVGSRTNFGCGRVLNVRSNDFSTGENVPYCASCFSRLHRPVGAGAGSALLSPSYSGQKDVEQVAQKIGTFTAAAQPTVQTKASKQHSARKETIQCSDLNVVSSLRANSPPPMWKQTGGVSQPPVPPAVGATPVRRNSLTEEEKFRGDGDEVDESEW